MSKSPARIYFSGRGGPIFHVPHLEEEVPLVPVRNPQRTVRSVRHAHGPQPDRPRQSRHPRPRPAVIRHSRGHGRERRTRGDGRHPLRIAVQLPRLGLPLVQAVHDAQYPQDVPRPRSVPSAVIQYRVDLHLESGRGCVRQPLLQSVQSSAEYAQQVRHARVGEHGHDDTPSLLIVIEVIRLRLAVRGVRDAEGGSDGRQFDRRRVEVGERPGRGRRVGGDVGVIILARVRHGCRFYYCCAFVVFSSGCCLRRGRVESL
mmetsp:Transcript_27963/g.82222  ORF Transcript_27963/g.82222 Transcript_27963/m.82222 type:complete len:259 (-) Transcript_27963:150-926(-)